MVFTENDKYTMQMLCTLVKLAEETGINREGVIKVGQHMGVPKEETLMLFEEIEDNDLISFDSKEEKLHFVHSCFSYMDNNFSPGKSELKLYKVVLDQLGVSGSAN